MGFVKNTEYYTGTVYEWNLPAGWSCPFAGGCRVQVDPKTGLMDRAFGMFRCYASSAERFPGVRRSRWRNLRLVRGGTRPELPKDAEAVRIHGSGDFFSQEYFDMWLEIARDNPGVSFWAFTKSIPF